METHEGEWIAKSLLDAGIGLRHHAESIILCTPTLPRSWAEYVFIDFIKRSMKDFGGGRSDV